jgi:hypothetical protein
MDKLEIKQGSFVQQTQYFIPDSQSGGNQCSSGPNGFLPDLSVGPACLKISSWVPDFCWPIVLCYVSARKGELTLVLPQGFQLKPVSAEIRRLHFILLPRLLFMY